MIHCTFRSAHSLPLLAVAAFLAASGPVHAEGKGGFQAGMSKVGAGQPGQGDGHAAGKALGHKGDGHKQADKAANGQHARHHLHHGAGAALGRKHHQAQAGKNRRPAANVQALMRRPGDAANGGGDDDDGADDDDDDAPMPLGQLRHHRRHPMDPGCAPDAGASDDGGDDGGNGAANGDPAGARDRGRFHHGMGQLGRGLARHWLHDHDDRDHHHADGRRPADCRSEDDDKHRHEGRSEDDDKHRHEGRKDDGQQAGHRKDEGNVRKGNSGVAFLGKGTVAKGQGGKAPAGPATPSSKGNGGPGNGLTRHSGKATGPGKQLGRGSGGQRGFSSPLSKNHLGHHATFKVGSLGFPRNANHAMASHHATASQHHGAAGGHGRGRK
jgi:hypothetical protein